MTRDPWADDWEDDWSNAAQKQATSSEIWSQANSRTTPPADLRSLAPQVAYKPVIRILKREKSSSDATDGAGTGDGRSKQADSDKATREARYKEARERLFGSSGTKPALENMDRRKLDLAAGDVHASRPARQSRGPSEAGRGGFARRERQV